MRPYRDKIALLCCIVQRFVNHTATIRRSGAETARRSLQRPRDTSNVVAKQAGHADEPCASELQSACTCQGLSNPALLVCELCAACWCSSAAACCSPRSALADTAHAL